MIRGGGGAMCYFLKISLFGKSQENIICLVMQGKRVCSGGKTPKVHFLNISSKTKYIN